MATFWHSATSNAFSTTLNGTVQSGDTSITLNTVTGLQSPGILVIDRQDGSGNNTPVKREFISYTGISGSQLTGVSRGRGGSNAQSHNSGALVEETMSIDHWEDLRSIFLTEHTLTGTHVISTATITTNLYASGASGTISDLTVLRYLNINGASLVGFSPSSLVLSTLTVSTMLNIAGASLVGSFPITPVWVIPGFASAATTTAGLPMTMPQGGNWNSFWISSRTPVSTASLTIDILKNSVSIFDTIGRPNILGSGTFASTASIKTKTYIQGDVFTVDIKTGGNVADLVIMGRGY